MTTTVQAARVRVGDRLYFPDNGRDKEHFERVHRVERRGSTHMFIRTDHADRIARRERVYRLANN